MKPAKGVVSLKLDGQPFVNETHPPALLRAKKLIEGLPEGEVFTTIKTCERLKVSDRTLDRIPNLFPELTALWKGKRIFGNARAIARYRKEVQG